MKSNAQKGKTTIADGVLVDEFQCKPGDSRESIGTS